MSVQWPAPCELLRHRESRTGWCVFRRRQGGFAMVPVAPLIRYLQLPGWGPLRSRGQHPCTEGRYSRLPLNSPERRRLSYARKAGWISERTAERILVFFGDAPLAVEWWGSPETAAPRFVCSCGVEMLRDAEACGFCVIEAGMSECELVGDRRTT